MNETLLAEFIARKAAWRQSQTRLPIAEKMRIVELLRDRNEEFKKIRANLKAKKESLAL